MILRFKLMVALLSCAQFTVAETISFNKHIRPILADRCFACHGPDSASREADLRLDREADAKAVLGKGGQRPIDVAHPAKSMIMERMRTTDPNEIMPPPEAKITLTKAEIDLVGKWIEQGAKWEKHWAFVPPKREEAPVLKTGWSRNRIDAFVGAKLAENGLEPSAEANRETLLRRLSFDLTGLPPTLEALDTFLEDKSPDAYERAVDGLLASPAFGERMAVDWLDVARYGDTDGLFEDHPRSIYPWRDWVVRAFNDNLPYRDFVTWQVAGDLMPDATVDQKVATGFLRNNSTSNEGGIIDEDYRVKYLVDRVNTTATAFLGLTLECAQCHDHKYDPMTQQEYFEFGGFFNNLVGKGNTKGAAAPTLRIQTPEDDARLSELVVEIKKFDTQINADSDELLAACADWREGVLELPWRSAKISSAKSKAGRTLVVDGNRVELQQEDRKADSKDTVSSVVGRYVRVQLPDDAAQYLTIGEVEVFSAGRNVALDGTASQASEYGGANVAAKAIDGDAGGRFGTCSCTAQEKGQWWEVDLGKAQPIDSVLLWNRSDCCPERLDRAVVSILDERRVEVKQTTYPKASVKNTWVLNESAAPQKSSGGKATDTIVIDAGEAPITAIRLIAGEDDEAKLNAFVISNLTMAVRSKSNKKAKAKAIALEKALATSAGKGFRAIDAIKGKNKGKHGWAVSAKAKGSQHLLTYPKVPIKLKPDEELVVTIQQSHAGNRPLLNAYRIELSAETALGELKGAADPAYAAIYNSELNSNNPAILNHYRSVYPLYREAWTDRDKLKKEQAAIKKRAAVTMIASDAGDRKNYILDRGEYDKRGKEVQTAALGSIMPYGDAFPRNRLGLASWLTDAQNPLTARVAVNRLWQTIFGTGIVRTSEDLGSQGALPSNQALLDMLAVEFVESGWDMKALLKSMVMSATYRQVSVRPAGIVAVDPQNRFLSHAPRQRLQAEFIRDHALMASGRLVRKIGGAGVQPYQPAVLFGANAIGSSRAKFKQGTGDNLYRRSLYTYWKRQIPAANMLIMGADGRTVCRTRRERTNTPLQALVMLNDPQFVEAARLLGERMIRNADSPEARVALAFRLATSRQIEPRESGILLEELKSRMAQFTQSPEATKAYLSVGETPVPGDVAPAELAAHSAVASLILNLDESLSKN